MSTDTIEAIIAISGIMFAISVSAVVIRSLEIMNDIWDIVTVIFSLGLMFGVVCLAAHG